MVRFEQQRIRIAASARAPIGATTLASFAAALAFSAPTVADEPRSYSVRPDGAYVYASRSRTSRHIGDLAPGATVRVRTCGEPCESRGGFVAVEPRGFALVSNLTSSLARTAERPRSLARILRRTTSRAMVDGSGMRRRMRVGHSIALYSDTLGRPFAERPDGTFIATDDVVIHEPSALAGERDPSGTLAFVLAPQTLADGTTLQRYDRRAVSSFDESRVQLTTGGAVPRESVRIAARVARPRGVPHDASWLHVDVEEQVLTAYVGDRWVFATVVTTGAVDHPTPLGTFRLHQKTRSMTMYGDEPDNYLVEDVADVQFFRSGYALHSAYWHDHFGERGSHGCVNLSPADARLLFDWAPPALPAGWTTLYTRYLDLARLYVVVE